MPPMPFLWDLINHWSRSRNNCTYNSVVVSVKQSSSYLLGVNACIFLGYRGKNESHDRLVSMDPQQILLMSILSHIRWPTPFPYFYTEL